MATAARPAALERLGDEIAELHSHISAATARWLGLLARFDDEEGWGDGHKTCAAWLSWRCGISCGTARDHLRVAHALQSRPLVRAAFERGELSYSKVRALMRLEPDFDEELMLMYARYASASQIDEIVRGCRRCIAVEEGAARRFAEREFSWSYDDEGRIVFKGRLPAELGAIVTRAVEAACDELGPPPPEIATGLAPDGAGLTSSPGARRADALVALAQTALAPKATSADVYQVVVHVDADALSSKPSDEARCTLEDGDPLPAALARRLCCDASVVGVLERDGQPISLGRKTRTIPPSLRRALRMRDKRCRFPGCTQRYHLDAHHIKHWADGGATELDNLAQLCRHHHVVLHEGGFAMRRQGDELVFLAPGGKRIPQAPRQPRGDCRVVMESASACGSTPDPWTLNPVEANPGAELGWSITAMLESRRPSRE